jgi:hypothetical protein
MSLRGCEVKGGTIGSAFAINIGAVFEQDPYDVYVSLLGCAIKGGSNRLYFNVGAALK